MNIELDRLPLLHARVCRNNLCNEGPCIADDGGLPGALDVMVFAYDDGSAAEVEIWVRAPDESALRDDDVYRFTLFDADNSTVYFDDTVTGPYCLNNPNGIECGEPCPTLFAGDAVPNPGTTRCAR